MLNLDTMESVSVKKIKEVDITYEFMKTFDKVLLIDSSDGTQQQILLEDVTVNLTESNGRTLIIPMFKATVQLPLGGIFRQKVENMINNALKENEDE